MSFEDQFYFNYGVSLDTYSNQPSTRIEISRLLNGQEPFISAETQYRKGKKTIVLPGCYFAKLTPRQKLIAYAKMQQLQHKGFTVNVFDKDQLLDFNSNVFLSSFSTTPPLSTKISNLLDTPVDELFVFNEQSLMEFLQVDRSEWAEFAGQKSMDLRFDPIDTPNLRDLLNENRDTLEHLKIGCNFNLVGEPGTSMNLAALRELMISGAVNDKIYKHPFYRLDLLTTEQKLIQWFLSNSPMLEILDLSPNKAAEISTRTLFSLLHPDHLKQLSCSGISNAQGDLEKILPRMTNLEALSLELENFNWYSLKRAEFAHLRSLSVRNIPLSILHSMLTNPSSIEVLILSEAQDLSQATACNFTNLKELRLVDGSLSTQALEFLIAQASEIQKLELYNAGNFFGAFKEKPRFPHLEALNIHKSGVSQELVSQLLQSSSNIKQLRLQLQGVDSIQEVSLTTLEVLELEDVTPLVLKQLLRTVKNLKYFQLVGFIHKDSEFLTSELSVEELNLLNCRLGAEETRNLLTAARTCKSLLMMDTQLNNKECVEDIDYRNLEDLYLSNCNITTAQLNAIIKNAPNLKKLTLSNCMDVDPDLLLIQNIPSVRFNDMKKNDDSIIDADTALTNTAFNVNRQFLGNPNNPNPSHLRHGVYNQFAINPNKKAMNRAFFLQNTSEDLKLTPEVNINLSAEPLYDAFRQKGPNHYFGRFEITLTQQWQALPSVDAEEKLLSYYSSSHLPVEICKSSRDSLYYIRLKEGSQFTSVNTNLELLLSHQPGKSFNDLPDSVREIAKYCRGFRKFPLRTVDSNASGQDCLEALIKERTGACRHRAIVFKHLMNDKFPEVKVRLITNDVHVYAEVYWENQWIKCDLGGYPARTQINERTMPEHTSSGSEEIDYFSERQIVEHTQLTMSDGGTAIPPGYFQKARNLTTLILDNLSQFPQYDLSHLDTLKIKYCKLDAQILHQLFQRASNVKTLELSHCTMDPKEFAKLDLSLLKQLDLVEFNGTFIPDAIALSTVKNRANPNITWVVDSPNVVYTAREEASSVINLPAKGRRLPSRYLPRSKEQANDLDLLTLLADSRWTTGLINYPDVQSLRVAIEEVASHTSRPCYYINSPAELRCRADYIERVGLEGKIKKGPGGSLYDFITAPHQQPPVLIINYNNFTAGDLAKFNSLLDDERQIEGVSIPKECKIIGIMDKTQPNAYTGADFYSRFDYKDNLNLAIASRNYTPQVDETFLSRNPQTIELCGGSGWEANLLGHWVIQGKNLAFKEGALLQALKNGEKAFVLNNAPTEDPEFQRLLQDIQLHKGIYYQGRLLASVPPDFELRFDNKVQFDYYRQLIQFNEEVQCPSSVHVLTETSLNQFLGIYECDEQSGLTLKTGLIEEHAEKTIPVLLTRNLTDFQWLQLLEQCRLHKTQLQLSLAEGVEMPVGLQRGMPDSRVVLPLTPFTQWIVTPSLPVVKGEVITIDISEVNESDLLPSLSSQYNESECTFEFTEHPGFLLPALEAGKTVMLKGKWSSALAQALHPLIMQRIQQENPSGHLILAGQDASTFPWMSAESPEHVKQIVTEPINLNAVFEERLPKVEAVLKDRPFVLLTGATGVGKTFFVQQEWMQKYPNCHYGEETILDWINDKNPGIKTLFIDEANITSRHWSEFEGLFQDPPVIFYKGNYYPLSPEHKLIFAGNPLSYGGERQLPQLFANHCCQVNFSPLPAAYLVKDLGLSEEAAKPLLDAINFMNRLDANNTLLTFREIVMIANMIKLSGQQNPAISPIQLARYFAYTFIKTHVPEANLQQFNEQFYEPSALPLPAMNLQGFVVNQSNQEAVLALNQHIALRQARSEKNGIVSASGGLGGLILEGPPGIGKSKIVAQMLVHHGFREGHDFYRIPVSLSNKEKSNILYKAFHEGKIVVFEEINSSMMSERELNAYLEGHDLQGKTAQNPGFMLIGTQNPIEFSGRIKQTLPLKHRLQTVKLPNYTAQEIADILLQIGLPPRVAQDMRDEFFLRQKEDSTFCFRDLEKMAQNWVKHQESMPEICLPIEVIPQVGSICKTVALANIEAYYAKAYGYEAIPLWSRKKEVNSLRKVVKANGSEQGEILEFVQWQKSLEQLGYESETVDFEDDIHLFLSTLVDSLKSGNLPMLAFPVILNEGLPDPDPSEPNEREHAAVVTGYNPQTDELTLSHWGKQFKVDIVTLFNACHALSKTRNPEFYIRNKNYTHLEKDKERKYLPAKEDDPDVEKRTIVPKENSGFKTKILVVKKPESKEALLARRGKLMPEIAYGNTRNRLFTGSGSGTNKENKENEVKPST